MEIVIFKIIIIKEDNTRIINRLMEGKIKITINKMITILMEISEIILITFNKVKIIISEIIIPSNNMK